MRLLGSLARATLAVLGGTLRALAFLIELVGVGALSFGVGLLIGRAMTRRD